MKKVVLTGGGTAGHVIPNLAIAPLLESAGCRLIYICAKNGMERPIVERSGIPYYAISAGKLRRYFSLKNFTDPFRILSGYFESKKVLRKEKPDLVFSKGGFVTVPVVFAAKKLGVPVVLHESDYTPGLANRLCIPRAKKVCVSFEASMKHIPKEKCVLTGAPIRAELFLGEAEKGRLFLGFSGKKPILLIMGGSLGAQAVNDAFDAAAKVILERFDVVHLRGKEKLNLSLNGLDGYRQFEYISEELPDLFAAADIVLSRSGAGAIFELLALHLPALLVPLPLESSRGDQILNAQYFKNKGYAMVLPQEEITPERLSDDLFKLYDNVSVYKQNMENSGVSNGTKAVADVILSVLEEKK